MSSLRKIMLFPLILVGVMLFCLSCSPFAPGVGGPNDSQTSKQNNSQGKQLSTSESPLNEDDGDGLGSDGGEDEQPGSSGYSSSSIDYSHHFSFDMMTKDGGLKLNIDIDDSVPFTEVSTGEGTYWCQGENLTWVWAKEKGEKELDVHGIGVFSTGDEACTCEFTDKVKVVVEGIHHGELAHPGDACETEFFSVAFNETWYTNPDWICACDDPEDSPFAEMNMESMPAWTPPGLSDKTLRFNYQCPGQYREENMISGIGKGVYRWTWNPGFDDDVATPYPDLLDEDKYPMGGPSCLPGAAEPQWGPSLSSIDNGVTEWESD